MNYLTAAAENPEMCNCVGQDLLAGNESRLMSWRWHPREKSDLSSGQ